jgi:hypothetical protein
MHDQRFIGKTGLLENELAQFLESGGAREMESAEGAAKSRFNR